MIGTLLYIDLYLLCLTVKFYLKYILYNINTKKKTQIQKEMKTIWPPTKNPYLFSATKLWCAVSNVFDVTIFELLSISHFFLGSSTIQSNRFSKWCCFSEAREAGHLQTTYYTCLSARYRCKAYWKSCYSCRMGKNKAW